MSDVDATRLRALAGAIKRATTNRDILEICDGVLALSGPAKCPVCEARRMAKAAAQKRWRANKATRHG
jgi:hypothetical protein